MNRTEQKADKDFNTLPVIARIKAWEAFKESQGPLFFFSEKNKKKVAIPKQTKTNNKKIKTVTTLVIYKPKVLVLEKTTDEVDVITCSFVLFNNSNFLIINYIDSQLILDNINTALPETKQLDINEDTGSSLFSDVIFDSPVDEGSSNDNIFYRLLFWFTDLRLFH
ncbi:hypothetical protein CDIK_1370 [Cucumispora dikerogammari]|nr:hypothetical protein CDIK_1370 [Cucumispora dikerogammari]